MKKILRAKIDGRNMDDSEIIDAILEIRGIEDIGSFLKPSSDALIPFEEMKGLDEAYNLITKTIDNNSTFMVYFDLDNDGVCAGTIATRYLQSMGANVKSYIGQGKAHGLSNLPLEQLEGVDTLIIVDSIDGNIELYKNVLNLGISILICDHHIVPQSLIDADLDITLVSCMNDYPNSSLSGSAVVWKVMSYIDYMNLTDFASDLIDLAATGLVGDMMNLSIPENRYICHEGFKRLNNLALKKIVGSYMFNSESVSFSVSPLINACMRTNNNDIARQMFLSDNEDEIKELMKLATAAKEKQKDMVDSIIDELMEQGESQLDKKCKVFWIPEEYRNLSGLLGNRLLSVYNCPLLMVHESNGIIGGSMRAEGVADFAAMVNGTKLASCSGHELAAGFECKKENFEQFLAAIEDVLKDVEFSVNVEADIEISSSQVNKNLVKQLNALNRISGSGWPPVKVLIRTDDYEVSTFTSKKHLKIVDNNTGVLITKWNCDDWKTLGNNGTIIAVGTLANPWYGRHEFLQLTVDEYTQQND